MAQDLEDALGSMETSTSESCGQSPKYAVQPDRVALRRAILVAGTHRSGTSALTRVLSLLGVDQILTIRDQAGTAGT